MNSTRQRDGWVNSKDQRNSSLPLSPCRLNVPKGRVWSSQVINFPSDPATFFEMFVVPVHKALLCEWSMACPAFCEILRKRFAIGTCCTVNPFSGFESVRNVLSPIIAISRLGRLIDSGRRLRKETGQRGQKQSGVGFILRLMKIFSQKSAFADNRYRLYNR
jgi:hypothetical protein